MQENQIIVDDKIYYLEKTIISEGIPYEVYVDTWGEVIYIPIN